MGAAVGNGVGQIAYEHEFVAQLDTANAMAAAFLGYVHRQPRTWVAYGAVYVGSTGVFSVVLRSRSEDLARSAAWAGSAFIALLPTVAVILLMILITYTSAMRFARVHLAAGSVTRTGFGDDAFVIDAPYIVSRIAYEVLRSVSVGRRFVFIGFRGQWAVTVLPREVIPDTALARIAEGLRTSATPADPYADPGRG